MYFFTNVHSHLPLTHKMQKTGRRNSGRTQNHAHHHDLVTHRNQRINPREDLPGHHTRKGYKTHGKKLVDIGYESRFVSDTAGFEVFLTALYFGGVLLCHLFPRRRSPYDEEPEDPPAEA